MSEEKGLVLETNAPQAIIMMKRELRDTRINALVKKSEHQLFVRRLRVKKMPGDGHSSGHPLDRFR
jgi:hypothetical protein